MGLIKAITGAAGGVLADQWREFFTCDSISTDVLMTKGQKKTGGRSSNTKSDDNIISNGSVIAVADGQCMIIVDNGKVAEICAEPGEFTYDSSTEPSIFYGGLGTGIVESFKNIGKRFTFGGEPPKDQRIYYFNTKEIRNNKYGTPNAVPFRVIYENIGLDIEIGVRCHGEFSYKIVDPLMFYTNVSGNVSEDFMRTELDGMLKTELVTALQPAFGKISAMGIRYSELTAHTDDIANALNEVLSEKWTKLRGLKVFSFGVAVSVSDEDMAMLQEVQRNATFRNPTMAAAHLVGAQAQAMQDAANNQGGGGAFMGFAGMNMANGAGGMNAGNLFAMGQQQQPQAPQGGAPAAAPAAPQGGWACACGNGGNAGKFCNNCGKPKPQDAEGWACGCGATNKGKFCQECGKSKPAGAPLYQCDKCGWKPADPKNPPKFCPECGDVMDDNDTK